MKNTTENKIYFIIIGFIFIMQTIYAYLYSTEFPLVRFNTIFQTIFRFGIWIFPLLTYLIITKKNIIKILKFERKYLLKGFLYGFIIGIVILLLNLLNLYVTNGILLKSVKFDFSILFGVISVGFSEDVLFRGFIMQKLLETKKFLFSNIIQSLLFLLIHFPGWIFLNKFNLYNCSYIFIFAIIQGILIMKTKSMWSCIILHSFNNFTSYLIKIL